MYSQCENGLSIAKVICFGHNLGLSISKGRSCDKENLKVCSQAVSNFFTAERKQEI